jgi:hypothetical protein
MIPPETSPLSQVSPSDFSDISHIDATTCSESDFLKIIEEMRKFAAIIAKEEFEGKVKTRRKKANQEASQEEMEKIRKALGL